MTDSPPPARPVRPIQFVVTAVWFALVAGAVEVAIQLTRRLAFHRFTWSSEHIAWMTPLSYLLLLVPPAAVGALLAKRWPRLVPFPLMAGVYAVVLSAGLLRLLGSQRLHIVSVAIVALGMGAQALRLAAGSRERFLAVVRRSTPVLAVALATLALVSEGSWWLAERRALRARSSVDANAPNILLLILDTVRASSLGLYGYARPTTPELSRLAARGVVFDRAIATAPWTLQSHASMFTGRLPSELSPDFVTPLDRAQPTIAEALRDRGYLTAGFVANHSYASFETGLGRGFIHYEDYRVTLHQVVLSSELGQLITGWQSKLILRGHQASPATVENGRALQWLERHGGRGRPFFAFINYMDAHQPYHTPPGIDAKFASGRPRSDRYDAALAFLDQQVGALLHALDSTGLLANTIIIVTSDHGEQLGEHGLVDHGNSLYIQLLQVPLVVSYPNRIPMGTRVAEPVSMRDLPATILSLAGISGGTTFPGRSLARFWDAAVPAAARADSLVVAEVAKRPPSTLRTLNGTGKMWSVLGGRYHYIANPDGAEELFDYWSDPEEIRGLADSPEAAVTLPPFRAEAIRHGASPRTGSVSH